MIAIFLDSEANGLDSQQHHMIELAFVIVDLESNHFLAEYSTLISYSREEWAKSNHASLRINGISFEEVEKATPPSLVKQQVLALFRKFSISRKNAVFICQNPSFDRPFFQKIISVDILEERQAPYHWMDLASMYWAKRNLTGAPFPLPEGFKLSKDYISVDLKVAPEERPHRAMQGVYSAIECYYALFKLPYDIFLASKARTLTPAHQV